MRLSKSHGLRHATRGMRGSIYQTGKTTQNADRAGKPRPKLPPPTAAIMLENARLQAEFDAGIKKVDAAARAYSLSRSVVGMTQEQINARNAKEAAAYMAATAGLVDPNAASHAAFRAAHGGRSYEDNGRAGSSTNFSTYDAQRNQQITARNYGAATGQYGQGAGVTLGEIRPMGGGGGGGGGSTGSWQSEDACRAMGGSFIPNNASGPTYPRYGTCVVQNAPAPAAAPAPVPSFSPSFNPVVTVSPVIQTTVSPQVSPVFQQAFQPTGSPMTAGTTQTSPTSNQAATAGPPASSDTSFYKDLIAKLLANQNQPVQAVSPGAYPVPVLSPVPSAPSYSPPPPVYSPASILSAPRAIAPPLPVTAQNTGKNIFLAKPSIMWLILAVTGIAGAGYLLTRKKGKK